MDERVLNFLAIVIEIGLPISFGLAAILFKSLRRAMIGGLLGAAPFLLFYAAVSIDYCTQASDSSWAFHAMWIMTFIPYIATVLLGVGLGATLGKPQDEPAA